MKQPADGRLAGRRMAGTACAIVLIAAALADSPISYAFGIQPNITEDTIKSAAREANSDKWLELFVTNWAITNFTSPVHENLTRQFYGEHEVPADVLAGVLWNDVPDFMLQSSGSESCKDLPRVIRFRTDPFCVGILLFDAQDKASSPQSHHLASTDARGKHPNDLLALIYRVHFGDLQFMHSMASWDGEAFDDTMSHVMAWIEFTYRVAAGQIANLDMPIYAREGVPSLAEQFAKNGVSTRTLLSPGRADIDDGTLRKMALGSMLHTIEDSFSASHVRRTTDKATCPNGLPSGGPIQQFYSYNNQDGGDHGFEDTAESLDKLVSQPNGQVVGIGKTMLGFVERREDWEKVRSYVQDCVYPGVLPVRRKQAGPGVFIVPLHCRVAWRFDHECDKWREILQNEGLAPP